MTRGVYRKLALLDGAGDAQGLTRVSRGTHLVRLCSLWNEPPEKPGAGRGRAGSWEVCRKSLLNTHLCPPGLATDTFILLQEPSKQVM